MYYFFLCHLRVIFSCRIFVVFLPLVCLGIGTEWERNEMDTIDYVQAGEM